MESSICRPLARLLLGLVAVSHCAPIADAQNAQTRNVQPALQEIEAAWKNRTAAIKSIAIKADLEQFKKGRGDKPVEQAGPFTDSQSKDDRVFSVSLEYAYEQGKAAVSRSGPITAEDPEKTSQQILRHTFDGNENRWFVEQTNFPPMGSIEKKKIAAGSITQNADLLAVNLWLQPQVVLRAVDWSIASMSVEAEPVEVNGITCRRIRLPRSTPRWTSTMDVDAERGWVPIQWQTWLDKRPTMKLTIKYGVDAKAGPVVKGWVYTHYDNAGGFEEIRKAKVTQYQVNDDIDDNRFTIEFPVGIEVIENIGNGKNRRYIQRASGLLPLQEPDFGRLKADGAVNSSQYKVRRVPAKMVTFADDAKVPGRMTSNELGEAGFSPLADNDSLVAWDLKPWHEKHWTIHDGLINYDGKAGNKDFQKNSLWTKKDYGDVEMYAEWRLPAKPTMKPHPIVLYNGDFLLDDNKKRITRPHLDAGDSGLMFRGTSNCQANIWSQELGSGEINGYRTNRKMPPSIRRACIPIKNADRPLGEWNTFLITVKGNRMTVDTNGQRVISEAELPDLPQTGPIGLQHHGDPVQFRQLWVKSL